MMSQLPDTRSNRVGVCPSCESLSTFTYEGVQDLQECGSVTLYTCGECGSTVSGHHILPVPEEQR
jgi:hypothetical protein